MRPGARLAAAVEVMQEILERHRPAAQVLADWGKAHRFAGSGDRAAIGNLVYDALRHRQSFAALMGSDTPRALILAAAPQGLALSPDAVAALADGTGHSLSPLTADETGALGRTLPADLPSHVRGDFPAWLAPSLERAFGAGAAEEGAALASRAPVDLRANTLKADRDKVLKALVRHGAGATSYAPVGVRLPPPVGPARQANVEAEPSHGKGWFEVQDEGSQLAAALAGTEPRMQVLDLCAGAGGKTLALAAAMRNTGQIYAYDADKVQLRPIFDRIKRAGIRNVQVLAPGDREALNGLGARFDVVFVDAPCTGSGVWRRRPDAKWRVSSANLADRLRDQRDALALGHSLVKPGGRLVYVTCSVLPEENVDQVAAFLASSPGFEIEPWRQRWSSTLDVAAPGSADSREDTLQLTPRRHGTDGFFIATLIRNT